MKDSLNARDPLRINQDLRVNMEDVIAEPQSLRTPNNVWQINYYCYQIIKIVCYILLSVICGPILSLIFGASFAILAFIHIWILMPLFLILKLMCSWVKRIITLVLDTTVIPCVHAVGHLWSGITIRHQTVANKDDSGEILLI